MTVNVLCNLFVISIVICIANVAFHCKHDRVETQFVTTGLAGYIVSVMSRYSVDSV